jgi:hypothetical protein
MNYRSRFIFGGDLGISKEKKFCFPEIIMFAIRMSAAYPAKAVIAYCSAQAIGIWV